MEFAGLLLVIAVALFFNFTNGFHDAANAIATSVSTRALTPRVAVALAALMNLFGALLGQEVARTVAGGIVDLPTGTASQGLTLLFAAVVGGLVWNMLTWWFGLPSSSTHALLGGLVGAALAASVSVHWRGVLDKIVLPMLIFPAIGVVGGYLVMVAVLWIFRRSSPGRVSRGFRFAQTFSASAMALGHGLQDAQKVMGFIVLALVVTGHQQGLNVPMWVTLVSAVVLSLGTYAGGWRIMRTLGRRLVVLDPPRGFAAEASAATVLYVSAFVYGAPVSTTHTITASVVGVGATKRLSAVRWGLTGTITLAWLLTLPASALVAAGIYVAAHAVVS